jgi:hypothetical protein
MITVASVTAYKVSWFIIEISGDDFIIVLIRLIGTIVCMLVGVDDFKSLLLFLQFDVFSDILIWFLNEKLFFI